MAHCPRMTWCAPCTGWLQLGSGDFAAAEKTFQNLVNEIAKSDDYGWLGLASMMLTSIPSKRKRVPPYDRLRNVGCHLLTTELSGRSKLLHSRVSGH